MPDKKLGHGIASILSGIPQRSGSDHQASESEHSIPAMSMQIAAAQTISNQHLEQAIEESRAYPKISIYSPTISAFMRYRALTTPRYPISSEAERILSDMLKSERPDLWRAIEERIRPRRKARRPYNRPVADRTVLDQTVLEQAIREGRRYPKITIYSPVISSYVIYHQIMIPRYRMSAELESRLSRALQEEDPILWEAVSSAYADTTDQHMR